MRRPLYRGKVTSYIQQLGDLDGALEEAFEYAYKKARNLINKHASELTDTDKQIIFRNILNSTFWELTHDLLIVSRQQRKVRILTEDIEISTRG